MANRWRRAQEDIVRDEAVAESRETDGVPDPDAPDQNSTTGTTPKGEYVGRVAGDDVGYAGETGAEARARRRRRGRRGRRGRRDG